MENFVNITEVVELVKKNDANFPIEIQHTGGGCMTVYAGPTDEDGFYALAIGPCFVFDGVVYGDRNDIYCGKDGDEDDFVVLNEETEQEIAQMIQEKLVA